VRTGPRLLALDAAPGVAALAGAQAAADTLAVLARLRRPEEVAQIRGLTVSQVLPISQRSEEPAEEAAVTEPETTESAEGEPAAESPEDFQQ